MQSGKVMFKAKFKFLDDFFKKEIRPSVIRAIFKLFLLQKIIIQEFQWREFIQILNITRKNLLDLVFANFVETAGFSFKAPKLK